MSLGITKEKFGKIITFIDFGNVNHWYEKDKQQNNGEQLKSDEKLVIDLKKLAEFVDSFSLKSYFYYGYNPKDDGSLHFIALARKFFTAAPTKAIQFIRHYLDIKELKSTTRKIKKDDKGYYIVIPKCNFDVEISIDTVKRTSECDTICILSDDADFVALIKRLHELRKKVILISTGRIIKDLKRITDYHIQAQELKDVITMIKKISPVRARLGSRTRNREQGSQRLQPHTITQIPKMSNFKKNTNKSRNNKKRIKTR